MEVMECGLCKKVVQPLDAHMGRLNGKLQVFHIECWNKYVIAGNADFFLSEMTEAEEAAAANMPQIGKCMLCSHTGRLYRAIDMTRFGREGFLGYYLCIPHALSELRNELRQLKKSGNTPEEE
ncbi:hypothetical protein CEB3_c17740 [Peptococcaceae bacterium CEB3]|nr:hypothetical protein CEB3_c17740 [Peptococcaceae bacterium CEB3]